jgi:hypothetical protein
MSLAGSWTNAETSKEISFCDKAEQNAMQEYQPLNRESLLYLHVS